MTRALAFLAVIALMPVAEARVVSHSRRLNLVKLQLDDVGGAEIEWHSAASFRFARWWNVSSGKTLPNDPSQIGFQLKDTGETLVFHTKLLTATLRKSDLSIRVTTAEGKLLMEDHAGPARRDGRIVSDRRLGSGERLFGFGPRTGELAIRSAEVSRIGFVSSSAGYGIYMPGDGRFRLETIAGPPARWTISAPEAETFECTFYYGPLPKEVLEEHLVNQSALPDPGTKAIIDADPAKPPTGTHPLPSAETSEEGLRGAVRALLNAAFSGIRAPLFSFQSSEGSRRAQQLAPWLPLVAGAPVAEERRRLLPYLRTYFWESRDRGFPVVRPMGMQFSKDPAATAIDDQYMFGDELLVAPLFGASQTRRIYLPMGIWTELATNTEYKGRQWIEFTAPEGVTPLFSKSGSVVPFAAAGVMEVHYFPKLAGEFFIWESEPDAITQLHAAPAGEFMRLEVESKVDRVYEWIIHHLDKPRLVAEGASGFAEIDSRQSLRPGSWFYDAERRNLHVRMQGPAGQDRIVNISF